MSNDRDKVTVDEFPSTGSFVVLAKTGPERKSIPLSQDQDILDWIEIDRPWWQRFSGKYRRYHCGHRGIKSFAIRIWGTQVRPAPKRKKAVCPDCSVELIKKEALRCCLCGFPILPGDGIASYNADSVRPKNWDFTAVGGFAVGCMRWDCCPSGGFFSGHWDGTNIVWLGGETDAVRGDKESTATN